MANHERPAIEPDAQIAKVLGLALFLIIPAFAFYAGTVGGKKWVYDYQPSDLNAGLRTAVVGVGIALIINLIIHFWYKNVVARDSEHEWYEPQAGHRDHH